MKNVELYVLSTCPWCAKTKKFLEENDIAFEYTYYDQAEQEKKEKITEEMKSSGENVAFPYLKIDDDIVVGWNPTKYRELLDLNE